MKIEYYKLVRETLEYEPFQLVTAAVWTCALCNGVIDGMGGPGNGEVCIKCGDLVRFGLAQGAIVWED